MSLNLAHFLNVTAETYPDVTAVILDDFKLKYTELAAMVRRVANILKSKGIEKGDKVAIMIPNTPHFPILYYAILSCGATVVPVNCLYKAKEIQYYLEDSEARAFFYWKDFRDEAARAFIGTETCHTLVEISRPDDMSQPEVGEAFMPLLLSASAEFDIVDTMPDDTAVILYTSGTTGSPKGAELTHFNMFFNALLVRDYLGKISPGEVGLVVLPLFHSFGQTCMQNATILSGCTMSMLPRFDSNKALEIIGRDKVTYMAGVPTMFQFMLNAAEDGNYDLESLRLAFSGGSALPVEVLNRFENKFGIRILEGYGLSETSPVASFNVLDRPSRPGSIGVPVWGVDMRLMREDGSFASTGEVGEIVIRGHNLMKGYYKKPAASAEAVVNGWLHTGDLATMDEDGYFFIVDRKKDLIIRGGMNIYPREIEEVLYTHPDIQEAAVIGIPDELRGEEVKACVSLRKDADVTVDALRAFCSEHLAKYKVPKQIEILPDLPKGPTGKILKRELRQAARSVVG
ncbi:MAG TPA: long-chain fatty acid--CoA ligase [Candidatus Hydrogenedentes bacterium]|nr:long-chain fatty acid--CoA ligase [Candidatus Hydrogenedentota bacterium]HPG66846.1 long-chain fatty acid--CoA ligase [Candidatus Hydrogenedentota bacterium]